jgi:hypothetical protein
MSEFFDTRYCVPQFEMHIVAIAWLFVVVLMTLAEATSSQGTLLGAFFTLLLYGVLPLGIVLYVMGTPMRRRARRQAEALLGTPQSSAPATAAVAAGLPGDSRSIPQGDASGQAAGDAVASERKEP